MNHYSVINHQLVTERQELKRRITLLAMENTNLLAENFTHREKLKNLEKVVEREVKSIATSLNALLESVLVKRPSVPINILESTSTNTGWAEWRTAQRPNGVGRPPSNDTKQNFQPYTFATTSKKSTPMPVLPIVKEISSVTVAIPPEPCDSSTNDKVLPCRTDAIPPLREDSFDESDICEHSTDDEDWNKPLKVIAEESYFSASDGRSTITRRNARKTMNSSNLTIASKDKTTESRKNTSSSSSNKENLISPMNSPLSQHSQSIIIPLHSPSFEQNRSNCTPLHSPSFKQNQTNSTPLHSPSFEQSVTALTIPSNRSNVSITLLSAPHNRSSDHISGRVSRRQKSSNLLEVPSPLRHCTNISVLTSPIRMKSPIRRSNMSHNDSLADGTLMMGASSSTPYAARRTSKRTSTRTIIESEQPTLYSESMSLMSGRPKRKAAPKSLAEPKMNTKLRRPREELTSNLKSRRSKSK